MKEVHTVLGMHFFAYINYMRKRNCMIKKAIGERKLHQQFMMLNVVYYTKHLPLEILRISSVSLFENSVEISKIIESDRIRCLAYRVFTCFKKL